MLDFTFYVRFFTSILPYAMVVAFVVAIVVWKPWRMIPIRWLAKVKPPPIIPFPGEALDALDRDMPHWHELHVLARRAGLTFSMFHRIGGKVGYSIAAHAGGSWNGIVNVSSPDGDEALGRLVRFYLENRVLQFSLHGETVNHLQRNGVLLALHVQGKKRAGYLMLRERFVRAVEVREPEEAVIRCLIEAARAR